jgi:hypothetical protein
MLCSWGKKLVTIFTPKEIPNQHFGGAFVAKIEMKPN